MRFLVTGARGAVGRAVVASLHEAGHDVIAAGSDPGAVSAPDGVRVVGLDLAAPPPDLSAVFDGVTDVFLYAAGAGIETVTAAMAAAGVRRVVLLSSDSVALTGPDNGFRVVHEPVERALQRAPFASVALRPGTFASLALGWADDVRAGRPVRRAYPDAVLSPIHPDDIADAALWALTGPVEPGARLIPLHGPQPLTARDQVAAIGSALARTIEFREQSPDDMRADAAMPAGLVESLLEYWSAIDATGEAHHETLESLTGRPARPFAQWVHENLPAFGG